jgi:hypothetical protein
MLHRKQCIYTHFIVQGLEDAVGHLSKYKFSLIYQRILLLKGPESRAGMKTAFFANI